MDRRRNNTQHSPFHHTVDDDDVRRSVGLRNDDDVFFLQWSYDSKFCLEPLATTTRVCSTSKFSRYITKMKIMYFFRPNHTSSTRETIDIRVFLIALAATQNLRFLLLLCVLIWWMIEIRFFFYRLFETLRICLIECSLQFAFGECNFLISNRLFHFNQNAALKTMTEIVALIHTIFTFPSSKHTFSISRGTTESLFKTRRHFPSSSAVRAFWFCFIPGRRVDPSAAGCCWCCCCCWWWCSFCRRRETYTHTQTSLLASLVVHWHFTDTVVLRIAVLFILFIGKIFWI